MTTAEYHKGFVGQGVSIIRKDGRQFVGTVESVRVIAKGTLMVISLWENNQKIHKSVYMEDMEDISILTDD